jgi:hypothetical protein
MSKAIVDLWLIFQFVRFEHGNDGRLTVQISRRASPHETCVSWGEPRNVIPLTHAAHSVVLCARPEQIGHLTRPSSRTSSCPEPKNLSSQATWFGAVMHHRRPPCSSSIQTTVDDIEDSVRSHGFTDRCPYAQCGLHSRRAVGVSAMERFTWVRRAGSIRRAHPALVISRHLQSSAANEPTVPPARRVLEYRNDEVFGI